jgi:hypothetical protein
MDSAVHFALLLTAAKLAIPPLTVEQVKTVLLVYLDSISNILELQVLDSVFSILNAIMVKIYNFSKNLKKIKSFYIF